MQHSAEIRWFFKGTEEDGVRAWFKTKLGTQEGTREDEYLAIPHSTCVGVKVREGKLEVKAQREAPEVANYSASIGGMRDSWVKWSRPASCMPELRRLIGCEEDRWVFVRKDRFIRKFSLDREPPLEVKADDKDEQPREGCGIELTSMTVRVGKPYASSWVDWTDAGEWWSFSFESFQDPGSVLQNLDRVASAFFEGNEPPVSLQVQDSMSYPVWLASVAPVPG